MDALPQHLQQLKTFFATGATKEYAFRKAALENLRAAILQHEEDLMQALYTDLKKSREESWVTEIGFLLAEIRHTLKYLHRWIKPKKVGTNLLNLPSKSYIYKEPLGVVLIIGPWNRYSVPLWFEEISFFISQSRCLSSPRRKSHSPNF